MQKTDKYIKSIFIFVSTHAVFSFASYFVTNKDVAWHLQVGIFSTTKKSVVFNIMLLETEF